MSSFVWLLFGSDRVGQFIEGVYEDKVRAEADLRHLNSTDSETLYWIEEKQVTK